MEKTVGVVHYTLYPEVTSGRGNIESTLQPILDDPFFRAVEITWIKDRCVRQRVADAMKSAGKQIMFSGGPPLLSGGFSLCSTFLSERHKAVEFVKKLVDMVCEIGARNLLVSSGPDPGPTLREAALHAFARSMEEICSYAIAQRPDGPPVICVEPFDRDIQWRQLLGPTRLAAAELAALRQKFPNCGMTLDMSHVAQLGEELQKSVEKAGDCLVHAHMANCVLSPKSPVFGDMHPPFNTDGGEYRFEDMIRFIGILEDSGYFNRSCSYGSPVVSLEIRPIAGQNPVDILKEHKDYLCGRI